jgi:hypothetical protein
MDVTYNSRNIQGGAPVNVRGRKAPNPKKINAERINNLPYDLSNRTNPYKNFPKVKLSDVVKPYTAARKSAMNPNNSAKKEEFKKPISNTKFTANDLTGVAMRKEVAYSNSSVVRKNNIPSSSVRVPSSNISSPNNIPSSWIDSDNTSNDVFLRRKRKPDNKIITDDDYKDENW